MRAAYLSLDRPDISYAVRKLSRFMSTPTVGSSKALKRLGRYLLHAPRVSLAFPWLRSIPTELICESDADFGGDHGTRKSCSGFSATLGPYQIRFTSKGQSVVSLSTSESEFYALIGCCSTGIGLVQLAQDMGMTIKLTCKSDATSAITMALRQGLGKAKHIQTGYLWIQQVFRAGDVGLKKVGTHDNRADLGTKALAADKVKGLTERFGGVFLKGKHDMALTM